MICIYHSRDLDGYCSGAIVKKKYPDATLIGYDYGKPIPWEQIPLGEPIIMVDVSLPMVDMLVMAERSKRQFTWIDHHSSAIKDFNEFFIENDGLITPVLEDGIAACEGTWKYLFPDLESPLTVELLGKYDTWRNQDAHEWEKYILPFQYGMRRNIKDANSFPQHLLTNEVSPDDIVEILRFGNVILNYQKEQNTMAMRGSFVIEFKGLRALACNGGGFSSQAFESVYDEELHDCMMPFKYDGKKWQFSLYTTKDIDLSILAKEMGGGGHKKACGFQLTELPTFLFNRDGE
jgi:oligoribonuclease NrnB/cAMP/cGMP phosphodiesterase (DHH superfamily)